MVKAKIFGAIYFRITDAGNSNFNTLQQETLQHYLEIALLATVR
ncbi:MAG: hypothetical protein JWR09_1749 [Mucilaginibacter sp.]|nr:hypothetical protein [Mucilaginibacter sp.]